MAPPPGTRGSLGGQPNERDSQTRPTCRDQGNREIRGEWRAGAITQQ